MISYSNQKTAIEAAQLRQLLSVSRVSLLSSTLLAVILGYVQREVIAPPVLITWCALMVLATLARAMVIIAYQRRPAADESAIHLRLRKFRLVVLTAGVVWGTAGFLLFPADYPQHQMLLVFMLAGLTAGGVVSFSADLISAISFSVAIILPMAIRLYLAGDGLSVAMSMAAMLYLVFMIVSLRYINRSICENITMRLEAAAREKTVRSSEERYRLLLSHSPVGIFHYDTDLVVTYCNDRFTDILHSSIARTLGVDLKLLKDQALLPALNCAIAGETGYYEGQYRATFSDAEIWVSMTCAPFRDGDGNIVGGIAIVQDITARKAAEEEVRNLAFYDPLTRLPNRRLLLDRINQAFASSARNKNSGALLFIDLDNFKTLNDTLGHDSGDLLLQQVALRLESCVREGDTVARLGGDEFVVILEDLNEEALVAAAQTETVGEKILAKLNQPYQFAEQEYRSSPSIGATLFSGHRQTIDEVLKQSDIAMYQAKKAGRNTLRFFDPAMQATVMARVNLESDLRHAIATQGQLELYYQAQVESSGRVIGAEGLARWRHPERGMVSPDEFIPLAEESGLILPLGHWVLATACRQLSAWARSPEMAHLTLSINISAQQLRLPTFSDEFVTLVEKFGIDPTKLKLEITESMLLEDVDDIIVKMTALKARGINFSMDDFGTGYSSLQYLKHLPLDQIKIDKSFVRDLASDSSDRAIVRTIVAMAKSLGLEVIAEGVEKEEQRLLLLGKGCDRYQGNLFGKPVPVGEFEEKLKQG